MSELIHIYEDAVVPHVYLFVKDLPESDPMASVIGVDTVLFAYSRAKQDSQGDNPRILLVDLNHVKRAADEGEQDQEVVVILDRKKLDAYSEEGLMIEFPPGEATVLLSAVYLGNERVDRLMEVIHSDPECESDLKELEARHNMLSL